MEAIAVVLDSHTEALMSLPGVVGVGVGERTGEPCVTVFVRAKTRRLLARIPATIEGYPVEVEETGEIRPRETP